MKVGGWGRKWEISIVRQKMVNEAAAEHSGHTAIDHDAHKDNDTMAVVTIGNMTQLEVSSTSGPQF